MRAAVTAALFALTMLPTQARADDAAKARGKYVFDAAGCAGCHTEKKGGAFLAGGRALKTPFGTFYSPNITPDPETGIGKWSEADFIRALRSGLAPDGTPYYPAFPYPSYAGMTDDDARDLWAYLSSIPPVRASNRNHDLKTPFGWRFLLHGWRAIYFDGPKKITDRGRYLAEALGHCGECHTPRGALGGPDAARHFAGGPAGTDGGAVPNVTPDRETGIGKWSAGDLDTFFRMGMLPDGDFTGSKMSEVVTNTTSRLTEADRKALIGHLRALPAIPNPGLKKKAGTAKAAGDG